MTAAAQTRTNTRTPTERVVQERWSVSPWQVHPAYSWQPQAQGDVLVLPWHRWVAAERWAREVRAARVVPQSGVEVVYRHTLMAEVGPVGWLAYSDAEEAQTTGVIVVPDGSVALLGHPHHGDLRIGTGVYAVRRQHEWDPHPSITTIVTD